MKYISYILITISYILIYIIYLHNIYLLKKKKKEPIINSQIFGPNNYHISYEGLKDLTPAQETLRDYDIYKRKNNINEFIFQKSKKQCQMEKKYLYQKLLILKDNTKDDVSSNLYNILIILHFFFFFCSVFFIY